MARGIIGGIVLSTLVTLVLVPVFYVLVERLRAASGKLLAARRRSRRHTEEGASVGADDEDEVLSVKAASPGHGG